MIGLLTRCFSLEEMPAEKQRSAYGMLCGVVGILLNILLFVGKFVTGFVTNSIAITADAVNNLSDAGSSIITLAGFKLAEQKPDSEHPYGHGRIEYIAGFIVSAIILIMGFELVRSSVEKVIHPEKPLFSAVTAGILIASILVKCYMAFYNYKIGKKIDSAAMKATATDSLSDCVSTTVVLISAIVGYFSGLQIDGICGVLVGLLILYAGFQAAKDTLDPLLGQPPEDEFVEKIEQIVLNFDENICGVHDLMVHDYGPGRRIISLHAEVPGDGDILKLHDIVDNLEMTLSKELGCVATIHMDPVLIHDPKVNQLKERTTEVIHGIDEIITLHDFRVVFGETHTNLIFDVVVPFEFALSDEELTAEISRRVKEQMGREYFTVVQVDKISMSQHKKKA